MTIGRKDKASFPEFGLKNLDIKIDTGAYTSAIHCRNVEKKERNGKPIVTFTLLDDSHPKFNGREFSTEKFREKRIKSSTGISEERYIVETEILIFGKRHPIQLSLSERGDMKTPILIGRRFLKGKFIVDTSKSNLSYKRKKNRAKTK